MHVSKRMPVTRQLTAVVLAIGNSEDEIQVQPKERIPHAMFTTRNLFLTIYVASLLVISMSLPLQARSLPLQTSSGRQDSPAGELVLWESDHAKHLIGMPEVRPKVEGKLV